MPPSTVVSPSLTSMSVLAVLREDRRVATCTDVDEVGLVLRDEQVHRDRAVALRDVRRDGQREVGLDELRVGARGRHDRDRNRHALADLRLLVVEHRDLRRRDDAHRAGVLERGQAEVDVEVAADRAEREAERTTFAGAGRRRQVDREVRRRRDAGRDRSAASVLAPVIADVRRPDQAGRVATGGARDRVTAPLDADLARERRPRFDDARLDRDLRGLGIELVARGCTISRAIAGDVVDDQRVRARVDLDRALAATSCVSSVRLELGRRSRS